MLRLLPVDQFAWCGFAPESRVLAVAQAGTVNLFDLDRPGEPKQILELGTDVSTAAYSPDGAWLVSGCRDGKIRVWSCVEHRVLHELDDHEEPILLLRFRADGTRLLSLCRERKTIWWDTSTWQVNQTFRAPVFWWPGHLRLMDVSPNGRLLACYCPGGLQWRNAESGQLLEKKTDVPMHELMGVCFSSDGRWVASTDVQGTVALWNASSLKLVTAFKGHLLGAYGPAFSPNGRRLVTCGTGRDAVRLWDVSSHRELMTIPEKATFIGGRAAFSPDGNWLAAWSPDEGNLYLWRAPSWQEIEAEEERPKSEASL
jgi:WD40 repeat protein